MRNPQKKIAHEPLPSGERPEPNRAIGTAGREIENKHPKAKPLTARNAGRQHGSHSNGEGAGRRLLAIGSGDLCRCKLGEGVQARTHAPIRFLDICCALCNNQ